MHVRRAFTLVELLIIFAILAIMAAIVVPRYTNATDVSRTATMASNVRLVRGFIAMHAIQANYELSEEGFPTQIHADWFPQNQLPEHAWTGLPMIVNAVDGNVDAVFPGSKIYDTSVAGAANAWYNTSNGAFCVRVPPQATDAATVEMFNRANATSATTIHQTTR